MKWPRARRTVQHMLILIFERLLVWLLEVSSELVLLAVFLTLYFGHGRPGDVRSLWFTLLFTAFQLIAAGYLFTTLVSRLVWSTRRAWYYPPAAVLLFLVHSEIDFNSMGQWPRWERLFIQMVGGCIVFGCTYLGSYLLGRWTRQAQARAATA